MGAWDGYYSLGGTEIANEERFRSYLNNVAPWLPMPERSLAPYDGLHQSVGDSVYTDPVSDRAPWVDQDDPVTSDFLGFKVLSIEGLEDSPSGAEVTQSLGKGGAVGMRRDSTREIRVTGLLVGLTPEAVQQGFTWLHNTLWRGQNERPLVPEMPGVSDFRFFAQRPSAPGVTVNRVLNPDATGLGESLVGANGSAYAFRSLDESGNWAYKINARTAGDAEAVLIPAQRALATPGSMWVARVDVRRAASISGERYVNLMLRFRDQYGNIIQRVGQSDTSVPTGVLYRWLGLRYDSGSQMLTPSGMVTNWIVNPSAEGARFGLSPAAGSASSVGLVTTKALSGSKAYSVTAGGTGKQSVRSSDVAPAVAGQQWWGRAVGKQTAAVGSRHFRADLEWLDADSKTISVSTGSQVDMVPTGTVWSWLGQRNQSQSMEVSGDTVRYNRNPNPTFRNNGDGYYGTGLATVAREAFRVFGTPICMRVTLPPAGRNWPDVGLAVPMQAQIGETIYVTFWTFGVTALRLQGKGWTDLAGTVDPAVGLNCPATSTTVPTRVTVPIKITEPTQILRICRKDDSILGTFRVGRIGLMTGSDSYFDGDTGTYEWEGERYLSSSLAHLPGNYDLYNSPWNPNFERDTQRWIGDSWTSATWASDVKRLQITVSQPRAAGDGLLKMLMWNGVAPGQRITAAMKVWNQTSSAVSVSARVATAPAGNTFDGPTVSVPANGSAWVTVPQFTIPGGVDSISPVLVARGAIPTGRVLQVSKVFAGSVPDGSAFTEAMWFDGDTPSTVGQKFAPASFNLSVGDVAPSGTAGVRLILSRLGQGAVTASDSYLLDQLMLAQYDAVDADPSDGQAPVPTLPAYFDGDSVSTYGLVASASALTTDASLQSLYVTANAPDEAVTAEVAVQRVGQTGVSAVGDVLYVDNVMLADYDPNGPVPAYTAYTRHDVLSETERWLQDVYPVAGPTVIKEYDLNCKGAVAQVEFTLNAENPTWLRDNGDTIPLPLPTQVSGTTGSGAFASIEDTAGVIRNFMPQFAPNSAVIPSSWVTSATSNYIQMTYGASRGYTVNGISTAYFLAVRTGGAGPTGIKTVIDAPGVLGSQGGYTNAYASVWLGGTTGTFTVRVEALRSGTVVASAQGTFTPPDDSYDFIGDSAHRFNIALPAPANNLADGFRFTITGTFPFVNALIAHPQVTLTSTPQPLIWGGLPDEPGFTYGFDSAGLSYRKPVKRAESNTIFEGMFSPIAASASLSGYDEVGQATYRTYASIPAEVVPRNASAVPVVRVDFDRFVTRWVRFRFYPNPQNVAPELIDSSTYQYEWVVDQFAGTIQNAGTAGYMSLVIDGVARRVWLRAWDGTVIPGDQYVVTTDGSPIEWPEFSDVPWVVSMEYPKFHQDSREPNNESWWRASMALMIEE